jgi:co-chaperonin GroES (HSP10)
MESKYLRKFKNLEGKTDLYRLNGGRVLVEILPPEEVKTSGGLVLSAPTGYTKGATFDTQRGTLGIVLLVGEGYVDSDNTSYAIDLKAGNVVQINEFGIKALSSFPGLNEYTAGTLALIDETTVQLVWKDLETFKEYSDVLNAPTN